MSMLFFIMPIDIKAAESSYSLKAEIYESKEAFNHNIDDINKVKSFSYGGISIGSLVLNGSFNDVSDIKGYAAYSAIAPFVIGYDYNNAYQSKEQDKWNICQDGGKEISGFYLTKSIDRGSILILKSSDGKKWEDTIGQIQNVFSSNNLERTNLYTVTDEELRKGTYFRVIVAYAMRRAEASSEGLPAFLGQGEYEYIYCTEVYSFFACYGSNTIALKDLVSGEYINSGATVTSGFVIDKNGSSNSIYIAKNGEYYSSVSGSRITIYEPGKYVITAYNPLKKKFEYEIRVSEGLSVENLSPFVYENTKKEKYTQDHQVQGKTTFGYDSHTGIILAHNSDDHIVRGQKKSIDAYGVTGSNVYLFLRLDHIDELQSTGWEIVSDTWGNKSSEFIEGAQTGEVKTGAIIIQKSKDGMTWVNEDLNRYSKGLFTTDYESHYLNAGDVMIYMPKGQEILNGVYIRILYAYEMKNSSLKTDNRYVEKYEFYLCSNELDAVTFHNLSVGEKLSEICKEYDNATAEVYQSAETLQSGSYTVSGFSIDTSMNPTVTYTVKKDGTNITIPESHSFTQTGKYQINLTSDVGSRKKVVIYVDRMSTEAALQFYFGDSFITGKRIFDKGNYAVYEGGLSSYQIKAVDENYLPLQGKIKNLTTGQEIEIASTRSNKTNIIDTPGMYEAVLSTASGDVVAGDKKTFSFRFKIIPNGEAPGPVVNQESLKEYAKSTITDSNPIFYSLTYQSAATGYITLAFATKDAAKDYAYEFEKGMVEKQEDGTFRYNGSFIVAQKEKHETAWDTTDAINYFAEQAVKKGHFDLSNDFTVLTLSDDDIKSTDNLRSLDLSYSVTVFGPKQKEELTKIEALPIISPKPYSYLAPGKNGVINHGEYDFEFIRDKYGCDSDSVVITDFQGKEYEIAYNSGVGAQLAAQKCPSSIVTITEKTKYGDTASYQAVYIAPTDNTAEIKILTRKDGIEDRRTFTQINNGDQIEVEAFSIEKLTDFLDPYCLIIVSDGQTEDFYTSSQITNKIWAEPGEYTVKVVNRLGHNYTIYIRVIESDFVTISFAGYGAEEAEDIITTYGAKRVKLPSLNRYGYNLVGFNDGTGILYKDEIASISFKKNIVLEPIWQAKQYKITFQSPDGEVLNTEIVDFGTEYKLQAPSLSEEYLFTGWLLNGKLLDNNSLTLNSEGDIVLVASAKKINNKNTSIKEDPQNNEEEKKSSERMPYGFIGAMVLLVLVSMFGYMSHRKKDQSDSIHPMSGKEMLEGKREESDEEEE